MSLPVELVAYVFGFLDRVPALGAHASSCRSGNAAEHRLDECPESKLSRWLG